MQEETPELIPDFDESESKSDRKVEQSLPGEADIVKGIIDETVKIHHRELAKFLINHQANIAKEPTVLQFDKLDAQRKFLSFLSTHPNLRPQDNDSSAKDYTKLKEKVQLLEDELYRAFQGSEVGLMAHLSKKRNNLILEVLKKQKRIHYEVKSFERFYEAIRDFLAILGPQNEEFIDKFLKATREGQNLHKFEQQFQPTNFNRLMKCIKILPDYELYRKYRGVNITEWTEEFCNTVLNTIFERAVIKNIQSICYIIDLLQQDPLYNFASDKNLTPSEKEELFQILWKPLLVKDYSKTVNIPKSLDSYRYQVLQNLMDFVNSQGRTDPKDNQLIEGTIFARDEAKFFAIASIDLNKLKIYEFFQKNHPDYFLQRKRDPNQEGSLNLETSCRLQIRLFLHQLKIPFQLYREIEQILINNELEKVFECCIHADIARKIVKFVKDSKEFQKYLKIKFTEKSYAEKTEERCLEIVMNEDPKMNYQIMKDISQKYSHTLQIPKDCVTTRALTSLNNKFNEDPLISQYKKDGKIDMKEERKKIFNPFIYTFVDMPGSISLQNMKQLIEEYSVHNNMMVFLDSKILTQEQKDYMMKELRNAEFIKNYSKAFKISKAKHTIQNLRFSFKDKTKADAYIQYVKLYGEIKVNEQEGKLEIENVPEKKLLESIPLALVSTIQSSKEFQEFKKFFPIIFADEVQNAQDVLIQEIYKIGINQGMGEEVIKLEIQSLKLNSYNCKELAEDNQLLKEVSNNREYKKFLKIMTAKEKNRFINNRNLMLNYIEEDLRNHPSLGRYQAEEKEEFVEKLKSNNEDLLNAVRNFDILQKEKTALEEELKNSEIFVSYSKTLSENKSNTSINYPEKLTKFLKEKQLNIFKNLTEEIATQILKQEKLEDAKAISARLASSMKERNQIKPEIQKLLPEVQKYYEGYQKQNANTPQTSTSQGSSPLKTQASKQEEKSEKTLPIQEKKVEEQQPEKIQPKIQPESAKSCQQIFKEIKTLFQENKVNTDKWTDEQLKSIVGLIIANSIADAAKAAGITMSSKVKQFQAAVENISAQLTVLGSQIQ